MALAANMKLPAFYPVLDTGLIRKPRTRAPSPPPRRFWKPARGSCSFATRIFSRARFTKRPSASPLCARRGCIVCDERSRGLRHAPERRVHLGQEDLAPADASKIMPPQSIIGFSTHNHAATARGRLAAGGLSRHSARLLHQLEAESRSGGGRAYASHAASVTRKPLVAIGGITRQNARAVLESGADSLR